VKTLLQIVVAAFAAFTGPASAATEVKVATASNFQVTMRALAEGFEAAGGPTVVVIPGSTGLHYAQILKGAPYQAFFAADTLRPTMLEREGRALPGSRFTYARGKLLLWSPRPDFVDAEGKVLQNGSFRHLALANPALAPYGQAAMQVLARLGLDKLLGSRLVQGQNVAQAYQFVASGNAELGFVALSQFEEAGDPHTGSWWEVPQQFYSPIDQQAVQLVDDEPTSAFMAFVHSEQARRIIREHGYGTP